MKDCSMLVRGATEKGQVTKKFTDGGQHGIRDLALLESALARPRAGFGEAEFYPDLMSGAVTPMDGYHSKPPVLGWK
jgi:hypothetical protein